MRTYTAIVRALRSAHSVGIAERLSIGRKLRLHWHEPLPGCDCTLGEAVEEWILQEALIDGRESVELIDLDKLVDFLIKIAPLLIEIIKLLLVLLSRKQIEQTPDSRDGGTG